MAGAFCAHCMLACEIQTSATTKKAMQPANKANILNNINTTYALGHILTIISVLSHLSNTHLLSDQSDGLHLCMCSHNPFHTLLVENDCLDLLCKVLQLKKGCCLLPTNHSRTSALVRHWQLLASTSSRRNSVC